MKHTLTTLLAFSLTTCLLLGQQPGSSVDNFEKLLRFDRDGDGKISRDEAPAQLKQVFGRLDRNSDGFITRAEMGAMQSRQDRNTKGPRPANIPGLQTDLTLDVAGEKREYHLFLPKEPKNAPIVFLFHGHGNNADELVGLKGDTSPQAYFKVWLDIARREDLILVIPNGRFTAQEKGWNDCRADVPDNSKADDVLFTRMLIDHLVEKHKADAKRVYATGHSNGAHLCIRLAQEMPEKLAAIAAIAGANAVKSKCEDSDVPVSVLFMNGTADPLLPYEGGGLRGAVFSAEDTIRYWVKRNGTEESPKVIEVPDTNKADKCRVEKQVYHNGKAGTEVVLVKVINGGHPAPSIKVRNIAPILSRIGNQNADLEMADEVWAFFRGKSCVMTKDLSR